MNKIIKLAFFVYQLFYINNALADAGIFAGAVQLKVNSTTQFYNAHPLAGNGSAISGVNLSSLGSFTRNSGNLAITGAEIKTFKNNNNGGGNVCNGTLFYQVRDNANNVVAGTFGTLNIPFFDNCSGGAFPTGGSCGTNDQKWQATGGNINLTNLSAGSYSLEIWFSATGSTTSNSNCTPDAMFLSNGGVNYRADFTICEVPVITLQPVAPSVLCSGSSTTITSTATGADYFEWQEFNGTTWVSTTITGNSGNASFTTPNLTSAKTYRCRFTNCGGLNEVFSAPATIMPTVNITTQPVDAIDCYNRSVNFYVGVSSSGGGTLSYQWFRKNGSTVTPITTNSSSPTSTVTGVIVVNPNYIRITNIGVSASSPNNIDGAKYYCVITESSTSCTVTSSEATLHINKFTTVSVTKSPLCEGETITFTSNIESGASRLQIYQWYKGSISSGSITGANNSTYTTIISSVSDNSWGIHGTFSANQTSSSGVTTTTTCTAQQDRGITVRAAPTAPTVTNAERCGDGPVTLTASGAGVDENFKWYESNIATTTLQVGGTTYTTPNLTSTTNYFVSKTKNYGGSPNLTCESATRTAVTATINPIPSTTLSSIPNACANATSFTIPYSATSGLPDKFSVSAGSPNLSGFVNVSDANLTPSN
nr:hypothetical protein [Spirosomataceae bacterium]